MPAAFTIRALLCDSAAIWRTKSRALPPVGTFSLPTRRLRTSVGDLLAATLVRHVLSPRVVLRMQRLQPLARDVGVDRGGGDVRMSRSLLPLPITRSTPSLMLRLNVLSDTSSLTRKPLA